MSGSSLPPTIVTGSIPDMLKIVPTDIREAYLSFNATTSALNREGATWANMFESVIDAFVQHNSVLSYVGFVPGLLMSGLHKFSSYVFEFPQKTCEKFLDSVSHYEATYLTHYADANKAAPAPLTETEYGQIRDIWQHESLSAKDVCSARGKAAIGMAMKKSLVLAALWEATEKNIPTEALLKIDTEELFKTGVIDKTIPADFREMAEKAYHDAEEMRQNPGLDSCKAYLANMEAFPKSKTGDIIEVEPRMDGPDMLNIGMLMFGYYNPYNQDFYCSVAGAAATELLIEETIAQLAIALSGSSAPLPTELPVS